MTTHADGSRYGDDSNNMYTTNDAFQLMMKKILAEPYCQLFDINT